uniref:uncharacterized protein LOC120342065 n=1 Tax=Styela clava TaxID=7725 RepID=UPI00193A7BD8|nr:uncharacterized protein LOC120342065 [Styela clava]
MATIAVRVGREVKEISGLTKSTTCWDVVLALLKETQPNPGTDSANGTAEKTSAGDQANAESSSNSSNAKPIKELAQSYVIVENWRGCEKPIPPRTRILNVWQAWGKEQKHVELSLKKSKHIRYRDGGHLPSREKNGKSADNEESPANDHHSLHYMSHHQKRRIRRNMKQYQRAVMMKQNMDDIVDSDELPNQEENKTILFEDFDNNNKITKGEIKTSEKRNGLILSEEKFVDGFLADPDCLVRRSDRAQLISQGTFNREFCKYRRRNHRRMSSVDGVVGSRQHRRRQVPHYPYSSHHYRRRSSRHRGSRSKSQKSGLYRYSTDDTSTTTTTTTNTSDDENAQDADDEKSVLIELSGPIPRRNHSYNAGLGGRSYSGVATTATDSSTTTSGDSMTSSMGCSTSSETSSGGDYYFPELNRLTYGRIPLNNVKLNKPAENSSSKPKKNKSILGGFSKPALNIIESFRKTNLKRKSTKKNNQSSDKQEIVSKNVDTETEKCNDNTKTEIITEQSSANCDNVVKSKECLDKADTENLATPDSKEDAQIECPEHDEDNKVQEEKPTSKDDSSEDQESDEVLQTIQSQDIVVKNQRHRLADVDKQIDQIEHDIHNLRARALGKNYVQDTYLSGLMDSESNSVTALNTLLSGPSIPVTTPWILQCEDVEQLEQYIKSCEKIVEMQLKIEETQRKSEIILQDMQEEVWRVSTDSTKRNTEGVNPVTKAAALMLGFSDEDEVSDDDTGHELLSVKSWNEQTGKKETSSTMKVDVKTGGKEALSLELGASRTELEASLYLSLRLAAEIDEVEHKLGTSDYLIQAKGENLIKCVRDLAMSEEGVDPEIWEEYGELLTAYDLEVHQRNYLDVLEASHMAVLEAETTLRWSEDENTHYIDATQPNPTSHCVNGQSKGPINPNAQSTTTTPALNQALTPWMWCEHCKMEEQMKHAQHTHSSVEIATNQHGPQTAVSVKPNPPASFSDLPLPKPINRNTRTAPIHKPHTPSVITPGLLPMLPLPDGLMSPSRYNDSDYEDPSDFRTMGSKSDAKTSLNKETSRNHGLLPSTLSSTAIAECSNNTDDSGNASAGSTTSFASSDGSRNSSCDGGSPRPIPSVSEGSKPIFGRNGVLRSSLKAAGNHFVFPINTKQNNNSQSHSSSQGKPTTQSSKPLPPPPPPASMKPKLKKPELLPKPNQLSKKPTVDAKEQELLLQQQKLIRRNNSGWRKNVTAPKSPRTIPPPSPDDRNFTFKDPLRFQNASHHISPKTMSTDLKSNSNYDNDSDTGRSSLHSVDSDQVLFSETLV